MAVPQDPIMKPFMDYFKLTLERAGSELAGVLGVPVEMRVEACEPVHPAEAAEGRAPSLIVAGAFSGAVAGPLAFVVPADAAARLAARVRHLSDEETAEAAKRPPTEADTAAVVFALARLGAAATAVARERFRREVRWPAEATALSPTLTNGETSPEETLAALGLGAEPFSVRVHLAAPVGVSFRVVVPAGVGAQLGELAGAGRLESAAAREKRALSGQMELARLRPVRLPVRVVVARRTMTVRELMNLGPGHVVDLGKHYDEPIELCTGPKLIARGEAVVVDDRFGFRLNELAAGDSGEERPSRVIPS